MYSKYNKENSVIAQKFIRILKNKIYKYMTPVSKNVSINKLDAIVNKYNNTYHSPSKLKPVGVKSNGYITLVKNLIIKILSLKLVILSDYQNIKIFLQKVTLQIVLKKFLWLQKLKILFCGHMLLMILRKKKLIVIFYEK